MSFFTIVLIIISAASLALRDLFFKRAKDKEIFSLLLSLWSLVFLFPFALYFFIQQGIINSEGIILSSFSGFFVFIFFYFAAKAYEKGDLSFVYPIMRSTIVILVILSVIFLGEKISLLGGLGIFFVTAGVYTINMKSLRFSKLLEPLRSITKERHTLYAFFASGASAMMFMVDKIGVTYSHPMIYFFLCTFFMVIFLSIYVLKTKGRVLIMQEWKRNSKEIIASGFLISLSYALFLFVISMQQVSYTVAFRQISIVFAVLLGGQVLKEKYKFIRFFASVLIFIGAYLISVAK